jgi:succinoglycan biosynthesis protein ExoA
MPPSEPFPAPQRPSARPSVSVVMPVRDEARHLRASVESVLAQDYDGELEVVMAVAPSRDGTEALVEKLLAEDSRLRAVPNPTGKTPNALNAAIAASRHEIVVRLDGHAVLPPDYVRIAVEALEVTGAANVGGMMAAEGITAFEQAVARAMTSRLGVGNAAFHTGGEPGPADTVYLGVFRRSALEKAGFYDERFVRAQDWELNHRIRADGGLVWFEPRLRVSYRPRHTLGALARQYRDYGRWRRVVMRTHGGTASPRYLAPPLALVGVGAGTVGGILVHRAAFAAPAGYLALTTAGGLAVGAGLPREARAWLPVVLPTMHMAWAWGFLTSPRSTVPQKPSG